MNETTPNGEVPALSREEKQRELDHLLQGGIVREGTQLHALVLYLGAKALDPPASLKEYTIGVEALGKPVEHDPRLDPTVRVEIAKLRKRLKDYYLGAGASRQVHLEIPHGSYLPVFTRPLAAPAPHSDSGFSRRWVWLGAAGMAAAVMLLAWHQQQKRLPPALAAFWQPHLSGGKQTLLVCGTPMFLKVEGGYYRDTNANRPEDVPNSKKAQIVIQALHAEPNELRPVYTFVGMGEAHGIFEITKLLASHGGDVVLRQSHEVSWEDLKGNHSIFLGGRKYNPHIPMLPYKPAFESVNRRILNLGPKDGEPAEYRTTSATPYGELTGEYALISAYPGLTPDTRLMTLDCSSTEGTLAAAEFITREDMVGQLAAKRVPLESEGGRFKAFQVVLHARYNKGVVVGLSYVTHRVMEAQ